VRRDDPAQFSLAADLARFARTLIRCYAEHSSAGLKFHRTVGFSAIAASFSAAMQPAFLPNILEACDECVANSDGVPAVDSLNVGAAAAVFSLRGKPATD